MNQERTINKRRRRAGQRPDAQVVRAKLASAFGISECEVRHYQSELGVADPQLQTPNGESRVRDHVRACLEGEPIAEVSCAQDKAFVWRFDKISLIRRGFARSARMRRAAEVIALAAAAHVELEGNRLRITLDSCTVVLEAHPAGALIVTAFARDPFTSWRFLEVADRVRDQVTLTSRIGLLQ